MKILNSFLRWYLSHRIPQMKAYFENPQSIQNQVLFPFLNRSINTEWGKLHNFKEIKNIKDFQKQTPVSKYEALAPYIEKMMLGEQNILYPGFVPCFSKSSGTTNDKSKYIPVSQENLKKGHLKGSLDAAAWWYKSNPNTQWFTNGKGLVMGGSWKVFNETPKIIAGDISALLMQYMPPYAKFVQIPKLEIALMSDWEQKIERMVEALLKDNSVTNFSGVPTWTLVLMRKLLEASGKDNCLELFPRFEVYMHGGVNFEPYRAQFKALFPSEKVQYRNMYNASEGFFAAQIAKDEDMLLLLNNGVFFEFIPMSEYHSPNPIVLTAEEVELGVPYALIITTTAGLWRYDIGDVVEFTSLRPHKIRIVGRTQQYINVFGEELMVANTDQALITVCKKHQAEINEYTAGPIFLEGNSKGGHEWIIEFRQAPRDLAAFAKDLDDTLKTLNSDYEAKRHKDIALLPLKLNTVPMHTFMNWMKHRGKLGGQHKVPRLSNSRKYLDEILHFAQEQQF